VTLESAAEYAGPLSIGVVMTGMGNDGVRGAQAMKSAGGYIIAQDEATSVIFGMNAEAIRNGAVDQVLPIENIFAAIEKRVQLVQGAKAGA
jgi:two-component system chemotaxis response regulator CheB